MRKRKTDRKRGIIRSPILQDEIIWLRLEIINSGMIKRIFDNEMRKIKPSGKNFDFYNKQNPKNNRIFSKIELMVLENIKWKVQESIYNGSLKYLFLSKFLKIFVIPEIKKLNTDSKKVSFDKIETLISRYNLGTSCQIFNKAVENAKAELKKVIL